MQLLAPGRRAFTLIEMVVVLAVMGIALAVVAPSMILPARKADISTVVAEARNAALRRSEQMTLAIAEDGKWSISSTRAGAAPLRSGRLDDKVGVAVRIDISPLGLCTANENSALASNALDPFTCVFRDSLAVAR